MKQHIKKKTKTEINQSKSKINKKEVRKRKKRE